MIQTMTFKETMSHDLAAIGRVAKPIGLAALRGLFWGAVYLARFLWFLFNFFVFVAMILTLRDCTQWFLGTGGHRGRGRY